MATERFSPQPEAPKENFARGLRQVEIPELGTPIRGKVRDSWIVKEKDSNYRVMVTTDRQSAFDRIIGTIPDKGQVLNLLSAYWFEQTKDIIPNHMIAVPHPNLLIAKEAEKTLPVEVVVRGYMAKSSTTTSIHDNYVNKGRRNIYGIDFPEGLQPNQEFPMGPVVTPTTKGETGHDAELTDEQAQESVDSKLGDGTWKKTKTAALAIFELGKKHCKDNGLILVDTKYEFGVNKKGDLMLIDEVHTPDSSRLWLADTYQDRFKTGETPDTFDKEILRKWLADKGFKGDGQIPKLDPAIVDKMAEAYIIPYKMITGKDLPPQQDPSSDRVLIHEAAINYTNTLKHRRS